MGDVGPIKVHGTTLDLLWYNVWSLGDIGPIKLNRTILIKVHGTTLQLLDCFLFCFFLIFLIDVGLYKYLDFCY